MENYFTTGKGKYKFDISGTELELRSTLLAGSSFEEAYRNYLDGILSSFNIKSLMPLMMCTEAIVKGEYPITIRSTFSFRLTTRIAKILNDFYIENQDLLVAIYKMQADSIAKSKRKNLRKQEVRNAK